MAMTMVMASAISMAAVPASAASKEVTIYFQNTKNWDNVYVYQWIGSGNIKGTPAWPGKQMTKVSGTDNWYEVKYTGSSAFNVTFNNNAQPKPQQTADHTPKDLAADKDAYWFVPTDTSESNSNGQTPVGTVIKVYTEAQSGFPKPAAASAASTKPAAGTDASPKTGDANENAPVFVTAATLLALAGMGTILIRKRVKA